jgi:hypothetical protein
MHDDLLSLLPKTDLTRRGFVMTSLAAGFALAAQPISAQTITTDTKGLEAGEVIAVHLELRHEAGVAVLCVLGVPVARDLVAYRVRPDRRSAPQPRGNSRKPNSAPARRRSSSRSFQRPPRSSQSTDLQSCPTWLRP